MADPSLGQVETPPAIAEVICEWAIHRGMTDGPLHVVDPAVGPGTFVVAATDRLRTLGVEEPLSHITAIDVDGEALDRTERAVAGRSGTLRTIHDSFLGVSPEADGEGDESDSVTLGPVSAVVGNPPYLRHETIDVDHYRAHLDTFGPHGEEPYKTGDRAIDGRSDAYVYFLTHATAFLREGGRLAMILPTKWLTSKYGTSLQRFLLDHYSLTAIVGFDDRAFQEELVETAVLCAERRAAAADRRAEPVRFVRVRDSLPSEEFRTAVGSDIDIAAGQHTAVADRGSHEIVAVGQATIDDREPETLGPYLGAPSTLVELLEHPRLVPLNELATVHRGVTTGANAFFLLDAGATRGIDDRFLRPALRSLRGVESLAVRAPAERYLFDVHEYVQSIAADIGPTEGQALTETVKARLAAAGYDQALAHIERGERQGVDDRRTCAARSVWFDLGSLSAPAILHPKFVDQRVVVPHNPDRLVPTNAVDCVTLDPGISEAATLGALNSTLHAALLECWGRTEGGGALQLMSYEVDTVPVLDIRSLTAATQERLAGGFHRLVSGDPKAGETLDRTVLDALDVEVSPGKLRALRERTMRRRVNTSARVLVGCGD